MGFVALLTSALSDLSATFEGKLVALRGNSRGALWVENEGQVGLGGRPVDISAADDALDSIACREVRCTVGGALKLNCPNLLGVLTDQVFTIPDGGSVTIRGITKVIKVGTTATGLTAYK